MIEFDEWHKCYNGRWKNVIVPGAMSHPAKVTFGLSERIYEHAIEEGWITKGSSIVDPFGGICGFGFHAMRHGCHFYAVELEPKFVDLAQQNIDLWNKRYRSLANWGTAVVVKGDSRQLSTNIIQAMVVISSPPYADTQIEQTHMTSNKRGDPDNPNYRPSWKTKLEAGYADTTRPYGFTPGQLGMMKLEDISAVISSPPYENQVVRKRDIGKEGFIQGSTNGKHSFDEYGTEDGQLGKMSSGDVALVLSSPPYSNTLNTKGGIDPSKSEFTGGPNSQMNNSDTRYGNEDGQLSALPDSDISYIISSPPFLGGNEDGLDKISNLNTQTIKKGKPEGTVRAWEYGKTDGDITVVISSPPFGTRDSASAQSISDRRDKSAEWIKNNTGWTTGYGNKDGQLGVLNEGNVDIILSSPPYEDSANCSGQQRNGSLPLSQKGKGDNYGNDVGQLANEKGETFWQAAQKIVKECYKILPHGGHAIWVTKNYVKGGKEVPFTENWIKLCEHEGFKLVHHHHAMQIESLGTQYNLDGEMIERTVRYASFFRKLCEKKHNSPKILFESVLCMEKQ